MNAIQHPRRNLWRLLKPLCKSGKTEKPIVANKIKSNSDAPLFSAEASLVIIETNARPHPGPLPLREGEVGHISRKLGILDCSRRVSLVRFLTRSITNHVHSPNNLQMVLPLLGERAGVRASVISNLHFRLRRLFAVPRKIAKDRNAQHRPRRTRAFLDLP
jgi:hypothetical protein